MSNNPTVAIRAAKSAGAFFLNVLAALILAGSLASVTARLLRPVTTHINATPAAIWLGMSWLLDISCAALTGFFVRQRWKTESAKWIWIVPAVFFSGKLLLLYRPPAHSVLVPFSFSD